MAELLECRAVIIRRVKANVAERRANRAIAAVNAHTDGAVEVGMERALGRFFGGASSGASPRDELAALKTRQLADRNRAAVLRGEIAAEQRAAKRAAKDAEVAVMRAEKAAEKATERAAKRQSPRRRVLALLSP